MKKPTTQQSIIKSTKIHIFSLDGKQHKLWMFTMLTLLIWLTFVLSFVSAVATPTAVMVKDINPTGDSTALLNNIAQMNGIAYFAADDGTHGRELWRSDGTDAGTYMLADINTTTNENGSSDPKQFTVFNGKLYFNANDGTHGRELWRTDGTEAGTEMVMDIRVGSATQSSTPQYFTVVGNMLFFSASTIDAGTELWRTDGTEAGTEMVKDINAFNARVKEISGSASSRPHELVELGGKLYFVANDGISGKELWVSDGTSAGTTMVKDGAIVSNDLYPYDITVYNGNLYFAGDDDDYELWRSDGTDAGTYRIKNISLDDESDPSSFTEVNGLLYFSAYDGTNGYELWRTDGTEAGTTMVENINLADDSYPDNLTASGNLLFFSAGDDTHRYELWRSDGTEAGTYMTKDINPGNASSAPQWLTNINGTTYFSAVTPTEGRELWKSDGTETGTSLVMDINTDVGDSNPTGLVNIKNTLFLVADDGTNGIELWRTYGTPNANIELTGGSTLVSESGIADNFTVVLTAWPLGDVSVTLTPDAQLNLGNGAGNAMQLDFTALNWNVPQTVTVTAVDDSILEDTHTGIISYALSSSDDPYYDELSVPNTSVTIADNDYHLIYLPLVMK